MEKHTDGETDKLCLCTVAISSTCWVSSLCLAYQIRLFSDCTPHTDTNTECGKAPYPNFARWQWQPTQRFSVGEPHDADAFLQRYGPSNWVSLSLEIEQNHWIILKRSCISHLLRADVQAYGHRPRYTARRRRSGDWRVCSKIPGCCLMVTAASTITEVRSTTESTSYRHLQRWLDWTGRANGLASQVTGLHTNWGYINWFWKGTTCTYRGSSNHQAATWHFF